MIKWGFIGCGEATEKKSGPVFGLVEGSMVEAVMSRNKEKAEQYAEAHGVRKWYDDALKLIQDPEVNAVYIATPPSSHATYAIMAMKEGKPVYVEKPMASNYEDCLRMNKVSEETGVPCFVAYYRRYLPYFNKIKELVGGGVIGKVMNVQIEFAQPPRKMDYASNELPWRLQPDIAGGGYFYDLAPHQIDILQDICGCILEASGYKANVRKLYDVEDTVSGSFQFESGAVGSGSWCFASDECVKRDYIEIVGEKGMVTFSVFDFEPIKLYHNDTEEEFIIENPKYVQSPLIKNVIDHINGRDICLCTGESATPTNWVMDKILGKI